MLLTRVLFILILMRKLPCFFQLNTLICPCTHTEMSLNPWKSGVSDSFIQQTFTHYPSHSTFCSLTGNQRCLRPSPSHKDLIVSEVVRLANDLSSNDNPCEGGTCLKHRIGAFNYPGNPIRLHQGVTFLSRVKKG